MVDPKWMQRGWEALRETFNVDGATKRDMIQFLLDEGFWHKDRLTWEGAEKRFNDCINPTRDTFFKLVELWALMKQFRRFHLLEVMADDLGFRPLVQMPTEERRLELLERIAAAEEQMLAVVGPARAELDKLDAAPEVRVHPAFQENRGGFSRPDKHSGGF